MEKLVVNIFKILGGSIILLMLLDVFAFTIDTYTTMTKLNAVISNFQVDISKFNGVPSQEMADMYAQKIVDSTVNRSNVVFNVTSNFTANPVVNDASDEADFNGDFIDGDGYFYRDLCELREYGEEHNLFIGIKINTLMYTFGTTLQSLDRDTGVVAVGMNYQVPCLKYTK